MNTPVSPSARDDRAARYSRFAWGLLAYNLLVIVFGAFVRATGSGAGCGSHWPLCDGSVIPRPKSIETVIEFTHRLTSGLDGILILILLVWAFRAFPQGHRTRYAAIFSFFFTFTEALLGAMLVKNDWVVHNASVGRAVAMSAHLTNTFLLLASLTLTAWWSSGGRMMRLKGQGAVGWALGLALFGALVLGISGAITALGDTLFPVTSSMEAITQSMAPGAHFLVKLRLLHPLIAVSVGLYLLLIAGLVAHLRPSVESKRFGRYLATLFGIELAAGLLNKALLAPTWMQLVHLLLADLTWIALLLVTVTALAEGVQHVELSSGHSPEPLPSHVGVGKATWKDYLALTKPRVISLLLFTTLTAMFMAAGGWPGGWLLLWVALGGYMAAGAANAINMVIDRDIDGRMKRTAKRPTVTQSISSTHALWFAFALELCSFAMLWIAANLLAALLALAGLVFYIIIYTLALKRRTYQNIVIGGAAGAFPPLVGWAAVTGDLSQLAWYLFAIIFVWTPVHFWALALLLKDDYAEAGVPMLPVVLGERITIVQIGLYAIGTTIVSLLPFVTREMHGVYLVSAILLNVALLGRVVQLYRIPDRPRASSLFHYSMLYLALLFLFMAIDRAIHL